MATSFPTAEQDESLQRLSSAFDRSRLDAVIDAALADRRIVGTVVLVMKDGQFIYRRAAGLADRERGVLMQEDGTFRLASITKPLVSAAALRLVETGAMSLHDNVSRWPVPGV
ncbi:serine hydrolase domain-containing protein [Mesorhizobium amorphae]|uniref:serine hydrolase domain-containing protein n=1 Tax=Mesorhizobium amorphae TaxID=71433 RepID=UPI000B6810D8|nr:serine hydrolase domain-containing protein [Mesorhizobium amorphae]OWK21069.1 hypothetical protein AJ88_21640 [Mesorhizobium amorphae CCBAU 01583]